MTNQEQAAKFNNIRATTEGVKVDRAYSDRCTDTRLTLCGNTLATKTELLKRGKVVSTNYWFAD